MTRRLRSCSLKAHAGVVDINHISGPTHIHFLFLQVTLGVVSVVTEPRSLLFWIMIHENLDLSLQTSQGNSKISVYMLACTAAIAVCHYNKCIQNRTYICRAYIHIITYLFRQFSRSLSKE